MTDSADGGEGRVVSLRISFVGLKSIGWVALAHNNFRPLLVLHGDHLVQKVVFRKARKYSEIEYIDVSTTDTDNLDIAYVDSPFTFCCKLESAQELVEVLKIFAGKGVRLRDGARRRLSAPAGGSR
jgi:hypothetical protein